MHLRHQNGHSYLITTLKVFLKYLACATITLAGAHSAVASNSPSYPFFLTREDLRSLATELAPKVDLFREVWAIDPQAEFYAGTTRDFLYWILGHFKGLKTPTEIDRIKKELLARPLIQVREMVGPLSDADIITRNENHFELRGEDFGIRKLDFNSIHRFNPSHEFGQSEIDQGYIPVEKLRLAKTGIVEDKTFGDGLSELISGKLTITFADENKFWNTYYAKQGSNHPLLLSIRYLRIISQDYLRRHGSSYPIKEKLFAPMSSDIAQEIKLQIQKALLDPKFKKFLENNFGEKWLNGAIQKSFRSFTNATATFQLLQEMGVTNLIEVYPQKISSILDYLLKVERDQTTINKEFKKSKFTPDEIYQPIDSLLSNRELYHGAGSEDSFRSLIFQGVIPSEIGSAGRGLYGVAPEHLKFAQKWSKRRSGVNNIVVALKLSPHAKIIDTTRGKGKKLFRHWLSENNTHSEDKFAKAFGADILVYSYPAPGGRAFVLKNADIIESRRGVFINPRPLTELISEIDKLRDQWNIAKEKKISMALPILQDFLITPLSKNERNYLFNILPPTLIAELTSELNSELILRYLKSEALSLAQYFLNDRNDKKKWNLFLKILKSKNTKLRIEAIYKLMHQNQELWPEAVSQEIIRALNDPDHKVKTPAIQILKYQKEWSPEVWKQIIAMTKMDNAYIFRYLSESISSRPEWPKDFWDEFPNIMKKAEPLILSDLIRLLRSKRSWPAEVWKVIPDVFEKSPNKFAWLLKETFFWPKSFWKEIPNLLLYAEPEAKRPLLEVALKKQQNWPPHIWAMIPNLLKSEPLDEKQYIFRALESHSPWPKEVWNAVVHLIKNLPDKGSDKLKTEITNALIVQGCWPKELWDLIPILLEDELYNYSNQLYQGLNFNPRWPKSFVKKIPKLLLNEKTRSAMKFTMFANNIKIAGCTKAINDALRKIDNEEARK